MAGNINLGNLYDINKAAMAQFEPMDAIALNIALENVAKDMIDYKYYMLLCKERNDYTIFKIDTEYPTAISKELGETLQPRGKVIAVDKIKDSEVPVYEIWVRDNDTNENVMYMLFECYDFIVEV